MGGGPLRLAMAIAALGTGTAGPRRGAGRGGGLNPRGAVDAAAIGSAATSVARTLARLGRTVTMAQADMTVRIPVDPSTDSLNVVVAVSIALVRMRSEP